MRNYYLIYEETATINYCFLFAIFCIAEKDSKEKIYNTIKYNNLKDLAERIKKQCNYNISAATISRILKDNKYNKYFTKSEKENKIILNINFKRGTAASNKFIILTEKEILFLIE